ncbi:hypothetical protein EWB00_005137 [Schistosoma japonicum]|uniref:Homologous recombination OB-fold protein OB-fold domain-containing protein n=1 Tax=Schistosoma japonicum TaxID=6182 RepID=A0A4Z2D2R7_SCHJA|nr:hypothetical protein EWB00_005137 [Schistosoma japonicum]
MELKNDLDLTFFNDSDDCFSDGIISEFTSRHTTKLSNFHKSLPKKSFHSAIKSTRALSKETFRRRKLPGPAGLLPKLHGHGNRQQHPIGSKSPKKKMDDTVFDITESCLPSLLSPNQPYSSQGEEIALLNRLQSECGPSIWSVVEKYSVREILKMITSNQLPKGKIPIMCGFLDEVELLPTDAKALLKDNSGALGCTIHRSVIKEYKNDLGCCSLLLLKQVSIFSPTGKKFYANITLPNIVKIYTPENTLTTSTSGHRETAPLFSPLSLREVEALEEDCLRAPSPPSPTVLPQKVSMSPISRPVLYRTQPQTNQSSSILTPKLSNIKNFTVPQLHSRGLGSLLKCNSVPVSKFQSTCNDDINFQKMDFQQDLNTFSTFTTAIISPKKITVNSDPLEDGNFSIVVTIIIVFKQCN